MTTELVAQQVINYNLNPFFDIDTWWSVPLWVWIAVFIIGTIVIINLKWARRKAVLKPVLAYMDAYKGGTRKDQQAWVFGKNRSFFIEYLFYHDDGIISYPELKKLSMWFLGASSAVGHAGGIKSVFVSDDYDMVRDPVAEIALTSLVDEFNSNNPDKAIVNWNDYEEKRNALEVLYPEIEIPVYCLWNPPKVQKLMPPNRSAGMNGGVLLRDAREHMVDLPEVSNWLKFAPLGICCAIGIVGILFAYMLVSAKATVPV